MEKGTIIINISDLLELNAKHEKLEAAIAPYITEIAGLKENNLELGKLYDTHLAQLAALNKRKCADSLYDFAKTHEKIYFYGITKEKFDTAFEEMIKMLQKEQDNDDLPF